MDQLIMMALQAGFLVLVFLEVRKFGAMGALRAGKIGRAVGPLAYAAIYVAVVALLTVGFVQSLQTHPYHPTFCAKAGTVLAFILILDEFLNGDDPPKRRRRAWLKNKFAKLVPARS